MEVPEVTGHESCHQENHRTSFQDDQEIVIHDISTKRWWCRHMGPVNPNRHCSRQEYIDLKKSGREKHCLERQRSCNQHLKNIVAFHKWRMNDYTASDAAWTSSWGENTSRNTSNKYTIEEWHATRVFQKSIFLQKHGGFENYTCTRLPMAQSKGRHLKTPLAIYLSALCVAHVFPALIMCNQQ